MKNIKESYTAGPYNGMAIVPGEPIIVKLPKHVGTLPLQDRGSYTMGDINIKEDSEEQEQAHLDVDPNDVFAEKVKRLVAMAVSKNKLNGKLKGHKDVVAQVQGLIMMEKKFISDMLNGKDPTDPIMVKQKAVIEKEAKKLERMSGLIWPFK